MRSYLKHNREMRLDLKNCLFSVTRPGFARSGFFLFWWRSVSFPGPHCFLIETWSRENEPSSATIVIIGSGKALVNKRNEGIRFNYWTQNTRRTILIYRCKICPYYVYILFTWESKCSGGCCFYMVIIYFNRDLNHGCLFYIFSLRFSRSKLSINLRRQFHIR